MSKPAGFSSLMLRCEERGLEGLYVWSNLYFRGEHRRSLAHHRCRTKERNNGGTFITTRGSRCFQIGASGVSTCYSHNFYSYPIVCRRKLSFSHCSDVVGTQQGPCQRGTDVWTPVANCGESKRITYKTREVLICSLPCPYSQPQQSPVTKPRDFYQWHPLRKTPPMDLARTIPWTAKP